MRLDKFLKVSRIIKRRTVANEACSEEYVALNGHPAKPGHQVKPGDVIELGISGRVRRFEVLSIEDNVSKSEAAAMYREL